MIPPQGHIPKDGAAGLGGDHHRRRLRGFGSSHGTLPAGFGCVSSGLDDEEVQATGQQVRFTLQGDSPSRYIVNGPSEASRP